MLKAAVIVVCISVAISCVVKPPPQAPQSSLSFIELTIDDVRKAIRQQRVSCEQLIRRYINRIETYNQLNGLNAIIRMNPRALDRARALDESYASTGEMKRLHCIPVILKDNFDTADMPTEAGSIAMRGSYPPDDAFMVKRLRDSDAIILAKSNMGEWAFSPYETISSTHGVTRNAYDTGRVPAGSSGGTASAIAANFGIVGMGTDTGNSIRGPASHLALVGIRPTIGATSRDGIVPLLLNRDVGGPLMRTVTDTAIVYSVIAGADTADPVTMAAEGRVKTDYSDYLKRDGLRGARLGVLRSLVDGGDADFEVLGVMDQAIDDLESAGAVIVDPFDIPDFDQLRQATGFCSRFRYDLQNYLVTLSGAAPIGSLDEVYRDQRFLPGSAEAMKWAMAVSGTPREQNPPCVDVKGDPRRSQFLSAVVAAMDASELDAIIYPSWNNPPRKIGDLESPHGNNSPVIAPHTGQPAITVPMGFTANGLPLGLQFLARPFDEHKLFRFAFAYEQQTLHRRPPAGFGPLN